MQMSRKEEIILALLDLASTQGLGNVTMNMIAQRVGIKKASLYNHFESKDEIVEAMYEYLREQSKISANVGLVDYALLFSGKTAYDVLNELVNNYKRMSCNEMMSSFYKVIYSERAINPVAADIMAKETERMILATKQLFYAMQVHGLLQFENPDMSALTFAMTIHGLMDYEREATAPLVHASIEEYLRWFCEENK